MRSRQRKSSLFSFYGVVLFLMMALGASGITACNCGSEPVTGLGELATDLDSDRLIFSNIVVGQANTRQFLLFNKGTVDVTVSGVDLARNEQNVFSILNKPTLPLILKPGRDNGISLTVQFLAQEAGDFFARLNIQSDANNVEEDGFFLVRLSHQRLTGEVSFDCGRDLNFGTVEKGQSKTLECTLTNRGNAALTLKESTYIKEKGSDGDFQIIEPKFPVTLQTEQNNSVVFKITYSPSDFPPKEDQGIFRFSTDILGETEATRPELRVVGITAVPLIQLVPFYGECQDDNPCRRLDPSLSCLDDEFSGKKLCLPTSPGSTPTIIFPLTSQGKTTQRRFLIRSLGDLPLEVTSVKLDSNSSLDFRVDESSLGLPFTLQPKEEKVVVVDYTPTDAAADAGRVEVTSNAGNLAIAPIQLEASSRGCNLEISPDPKLGINFTGPRAQRITIFNVGNEACIVDRIAFGKGAPFSMIPVQRENQPIAPNGLIEFLVRFDATDKTLYEDKLIVTSSDPDEPTLELPLKGQIIGDKPCELVANPARLDFGLVPVGRNRRLSVNITNNGYGDCIIESANPIIAKGLQPAANTAFTIDSQITYPITIPAGENRRYDVNYTPPQSISGYQGELEIPSKDGLGDVQPVLKIQLIGASGNLCLEIVPPQMDFGSSKVDCATPDREINIYNLGAAGCAASITVTKVEIDPSTNLSKEFQLRSVPTLPRTLTSGQNMVVKARYKPADLGVDFGTLNVENSVAGQSPLPIPLAGEGVSSSEQKDVFSQLRQPKADILFVIDDSCSMSPYQNSLSTNARSFIDWAVRLNVDYHIMVTTTDVTGRVTTQCARPSGIPGCACLGPGSSARIITQATPNPEASFQANAVTGTTGDAIEKGLEAAFKALTPPASTNPNCNLPFYRQEASLSIIFVSDEKDQSPQPVNFYVTFFKNLKGFRNLDMIRASSIVGPLPNGCTAPGGGFAEAAPRYIEVQQQLGGVFESLCTPNWAVALSNIGSITFGYRKQFFLSRQADVPTIQVKVNGQPVAESATAGWVYEAITNSVVFAENSIPPPGAAVEVQYQAVCLP